MKQFRFRNDCFYLFLQNSNRLTGNCNGEDYFIVGCSFFGLEANRGGAFCIERQSSVFCRQSTFTRCKTDTTYPQDVFLQNVAAAGFVKTNKECEVVNSCFTRTASSHCLTISTHDTNCTKISLNSITLCPDYQYLCYQTFHIKYGKLG